MKEFLRKISSRKLWAAIVGVIVGIAAAFGIDASEYAQVVGIVTSCVSVIAYICGEAQVDAANAEARGKIEAASAPVVLEFPDDKIADVCENAEPAAVPEEGDTGDDGSS